MEVQNIVPALRTSASATPVAAAKPKRLQNHFGAAFINSNSAGHERKNKIDDFRERLDDVGLRQREA